MLSTLEAVVTILSAGEEGEQGTGNVPGGGGSAVRFGGLVPQIDVFLSLVSWSPLVTVAALKEAHLFWELI